MKVLDNGGFASGSCPSRWHQRRGSRPLHSPKNGISESLGCAGRGHSLALREGFTSYWSQRWGVKEGQVLGRLIPTLITRSTALRRLGPSDGAPLPAAPAYSLPSLCTLGFHGGRGEQPGGSGPGGLTHRVDPRDAEQGGGRAIEDPPAGQHGGKRRTVGRILMDKSREPKGRHTGPLGCQRTELLQKNTVLSPFSHFPPASGVNR